MPLLTSSTAAGNPLAGPTLAFFGAGGAQQPSGYAPVSGVGAAARTAPAYTPVVLSTAYTGGLLDLTQALRLPDGNALRLAYENLRQAHEALVKQHNALVVDLMALGLIAG